MNLILFKFIIYIYYLSHMHEYYLFIYFTFKMYIFD